jgi:hypothetical protein
MKPADLMKVTFGCAVLLATSLIAGPAAAQCTPPPPGLVSWWPAEGDATDVTGGNNGTLGGATTFAAGMVGQAFKFGGAANDAVAVGAAPNLQLQSFSIEGWISRARHAEEHAYLSVWYRRHLRLRLAGLWLRNLGRRPALSHED